MTLSPKGTYSSCGWVAAGPDETLPDVIEITSTGLRGDDGVFNLTVPNEGLRTTLWYLLDQKRLADGAEVPASFIAGCPIPGDLVGCAAAIRAARQSSAADEFEAARTGLDKVAAAALGLSASELAYIAQRLDSDPFLSQLRPMWAHRGLHVQGYQEHSGGDRFAN